MYNLFFSLFAFIGWRGELPESAAFACTALTILFAINFTISFFTGYNPAIRFAKWIDKVYFN